MQTQTAAHAYAHSYIAPELLARLRNLKNHRGHLPRQVNSFSMNYYHPGLITRRWYLPHTSLPYPHVVTTKENGTKLSLCVLKSQEKSVIQIKMANGLWWKESVFDESDFAAHVPHVKRTTAPATIRQIRMLTGMLFLPSLPQLSFGNANLLIQELIMSPYLDEVRELIEK